MKKKILAQLIALGLITTSLTTSFAQAIKNDENTTQKEIVVTKENVQVDETLKEDKKDILTVHGLSRYDIRRDNMTGKKGETKKSLWRTRLEPTLDLGDGWKIKNRMDLEFNYKAKADKKEHFYNRMLYVQGRAFGGTISAGKVDYADFANMDIAYGMIYDDYVKGVKYTYTDKNTNAIYTTMIGNFDSPHNDNNNGKMSNYPEYDAMHYAGLQLEYPVNEKLMTGLAYHNVRSGELDDTQQILEIAGEYKIDNNFKLGTVYAISTLDYDDYNLSSSDQEQAYVIQLNYKGAKRAVPNTFGVWASYKNVGQLATFVPTYTNSFVGEQGIELGTRYVFAPNLTGEVSYFNGKQIDNHDKTKTRWFGRIEYRF